MDLQPSPEVQERLCTGGVELAESCRMNQSQVVEGVGGEVCSEEAVQPSEQLMLLYYFRDFKLQNSFGFWKLVRVVEFALNFS